MFLWASYGHSHSGPWMLSAKKDFDASLCSSERKNQEIDQMVTFVYLSSCVFYNLEVNDVEITYSHAPSQLCQEDSGH